MDEAYISVKDAAERLGVKRPSLYHYVKVLKLETQRFELDRQTYLKMTDFERIRTLREDAARRKAPAA